MGEAVKLRQVLKRIKRGKKMSGSDRIYKPEACFYYDEARRFAERLMLQDLYATANKGPLDLLIT